MDKVNEDFIKMFVSDELFDVEKLINIIDSEQEIDSTIFSRCQHRKYMRGCYPKILDFSFGFPPITKDTFIRRCPFYFYSGKDVLSMLIEDAYIRGYQCERVYMVLEYLFYKWQLPLEDIYSYIMKQNCEELSATLFLWRDYLLACNIDENLGVYPDRLSYEYNRFLSSHMNIPRKYTAKFVNEKTCQKDKVAIFTGKFPCNKAGRPVIRWTNLKFEFVEYAKCTCEHSEEGLLEIGLTPNTLIWEKQEVDKEDVVYRLIYGDPNSVIFNYRILSYKRMLLGLSEEDMASKVGISVNTYKLWEIGKVMPSSIFLLRLIVFLGLDIGEIVLNRKVLEYE